MSNFETYIVQLSVYMCLEIINEKEIVYYINLRSKDSHFVILDIVFKVAYT